jgi:hypothetical protein
MPDDPALTEGFLATEVAPLLPVIRDNAPADIASEVGVRVAAEELAITGDDSPRRDGTGPPHFVEGMSREFVVE